MQTFTKWRFIVSRATLLAAVIGLIVPLGASAQQPSPAKADAPADDPSLKVPQEELNTTEADARAAALEAQIEALQAQLNDLKAQVAKNSPSWKGAPLFTDNDEGWSFKIRGRVQVDAGYTNEPPNYTANRNLDYNIRIRRFRLGIEGSIPGDFGYKAEIDFANAAVGFGDVVLSYTPKASHWSAILGNQESLNGIEQITSSRFTSFIERWQGDDAFTNTRRLGLNIGYATKDNLLRANIGVFTAHSIDASLDNHGWIAAARVTYTPYVLNGFAHIGFNFQHRNFQSNDNGVASISNGAPSTNQLARYRARPFLQTTDVRFVDTGNFAARSDNIYGGELYGVFKSLHLGGEFAFTQVDVYAPGTVLSNPRDFFTGGNSAVTPTGSPTFFSGFAEIGYFLTGETRGYKNGLWDRTKVLNPFSKGGWGALQILFRYDYLDLDQGKLKNAVTTNFTTGATTLAADSVRLSRGGRQTGYLFGATWIPSDYVRFLFNYIHTDVQGGPFAAAAVPNSLLPVDQRSFSTDGFAARAQLDF